MKKEEHLKHHEKHASKEKEASVKQHHEKHAFSVQHISRPRKMHPLAFLTNLFKKKSEKKEPSPVEALPVAQELLPKLEPIQELTQIMASQEDAVNKLYKMDILLRKYYAKEYKISKKLQYSEMITQLESSKPDAASLVQKIINYAYSGKPLEESQMHEILKDFQQLMLNDAARKIAEKEAHRKHKGASEKIEVQTSLADKLTPVSPQLPPSAHPLAHVPHIDLQRFQNKVSEIIAKIKNLPVPTIFARAQLPEKTKQAKMPHKKPHEPTAETSHFHLPHIHMPNIHMPNIHMPHMHMPDFQKTKLNLKRLSLPSIHAPHIDLPKIALPHINRHESHAPRVKLLSFKRVGQAISNMHMPHLHMPKMHLPHHLPGARFGKRIGKYVEESKNNMPEVHPGEYIASIREHLPNIHPREYYEYVKEAANTTWEKFHPPKATEEELALQEELAQEQEIESQKQNETQEAENAAAAMQAEKDKSKKEDKEKISTPAPIVIEPEKYWIEYKPRHHARGVTHHFAYEIDDYHHIKKILKHHQKPNLI